MNNMNSLIIEGNVSRDVVMHDVGFPNVDFEISVERRFKNNEGNWETETCYFTVVCFGNMAESVQKFAKLERGVRVVGRYNNPHLQTG